jgi:hypothetical protein
MHGPTLLDGRAMIRSFGRQWVDFVRPPKVLLKKGEAWGYPPGLKCSAARVRYSKTTVPAWPRYILFRGRGGENRGEGIPNLEFRWPQAEGSAQGTTWTWFEACCIRWLWHAVAGRGVSGSICLVRWFEVSKQRQGGGSLGRGEWAKVTWFDSWKSDVYSLIIWADSRRAVLTGWGCEIHFSNEGTY